MKETNRAGVVADISAVFRGIWLDWGEMETPAAAFERGGPIGARPTTTVAYGAVIGTIIGAPVAARGPRYRA